jgi:hypothetical protein
MADESGFSILQYRGKIPALAVCTRCQLKFFTPPKLIADSEKAQDYLWGKYEAHQCPILPKTRTDRDFQSFLEDYDRRRPRSRLTSMLKFPL